MKRKSLNPDVKNTPATTDDQAAVVNAFMRLAASAECVLRWSNVKYVN